MPRQLFSSDWNPQGIWPPSSVCSLHHITDAFQFRMERPVDFTPVAEIRVLGILPKRQGHDRFFRARCEVFKQMGQHPVHLADLRDVLLMKVRFFDA